MIKLTCLECGKEFEVYPSRIKKGKVKYCSLKCLGESNKAKNNVKCIICGKEFHVKPFRLKKIKNENNICCSKKCLYELKKTEMLGELNHQYGLKGELNDSFVSDIKINNYGYLLIRIVNHPFSQYNDFVFFHRIILENHLRINYPDSEYLVEVEGYNELFLDPDAVVHHKDCNKLNNTISNLEIMNFGDHSALHSKFRNMERDENGRFIKIAGKQKGQKITKKYKFDAGLDISSNEDCIIEPNSRKLISTDLFIEIPDNYVGLIWSRSGLAVKHGIECGAGCIDSNYRGEVKVLLFNYSDKPFTIKKGDRIAQLLTIPINVENYTNVENIDSSDRGTSGFGSTGL